jgi:hypothetical protein
MAIITTQNNRRGKNMIEQTQKIIKAAKGFKTWGRWAAMRYCEKNNLPLSLVTLARVLENAKGL